MDAQDGFGFLSDVSVPEVVASRSDLDACSPFISSPFPLIVDPKKENTAPLTTARIPPARGGGEGPSHAILTQAKGQTGERRRRDGERGVGGIPGLGWLRVDWGGPHRSFGGDQATMARPEEKAKSMLNRWLKGQQEEGGSGLKRRRPYMASACKDLNECDKWRGQILRDIGAKVMEIQNSALQEDRIRELNDEINKLMRVKHAWEKQILKLGGPNYIKQASKLQEDEGEGIPGGESPGRR